ncbi:polysaccharide biosynthesis protein, partial [Candidatus Marinimicrobia bacterium]|nr:polysaccharide biosynthesis protein [Candidatus Neomarinimicrobiota bacterium]
SFLLSIFIRFDFSFPHEITFLFTFPNIIIFIGIKVFSFKLFALYSGMWRYTSVWDLLNILKGSFFGSFVIVIGISYKYGFENISRSLFILDFIICTISISILRLGIRLFFTHLQEIISVEEKDVIKKSILIVGAGFSGQAILRQSLQNNLPIKVIGFLDDDIEKIGRKIHGRPILCEVDKIEKIESHFEEIYICVPSASRRQMTKIIEICKKTNKPIKTLPSLSEIISDKVSISHLRNVSILDLLGRDEVKLNIDLINKTFKGKRVLITGAGGSIGSELVRQCLNFSPSLLIMIDISELNLFDIEREIKQNKSEVLVKPVLCDIRDSLIINQIFEDYKPQVVLHAAAYKHVPIQENFPWEAIKTNIFGTINLSVTSINHNVEKFVLVSTDKAVKPTNVMGATKRLAEMVSLYFDRSQNDTDFMAVRFGNVLGSSGSVIPIFQDQIKNGGPLTITDPNMKRFFMSIPEASQLILQAGSIGKGGEVFILDMGRPIKIIDIANQLIKLSGYEPGKDIEIKVTGSRPGEKIVEELSLPNENLDKTTHNKIMVLNDSLIDNKNLKKVFKDIKYLERSIAGRDAEEVRLILASILPEYEPDTKGVESIKSNLAYKAEA